MSETFEYTYSAQQQEEILRIREKYAAPREDKMAALRRLDQSAGQKAQAASIAVGVIGTLILGTGMSLLMTDFAHLGGMLTLLLGLGAGIAGLVLVALAYPIYQKTLTKERARIAPEILRLTDELMK